MLDLEAILQAVSDVEHILAFGGAVLFAVLYGGFYQWWKTRAGRSFFFYIISLVALATIGFVTRVAGEEHWLRPLWLCLTWAFSLWAVSYSIYALLRRWTVRERVVIEPREPRTSPVQTVKHDEPKEL